MIKKLILLLLPIVAQSQSTDKLHFKSLLSDTHNDFLSKAVEKGYAMDANLKGKTHSDLARFKQGGVDVQVFSVFCDGSFKNGTAFVRANREMDSLYAVIKRNPDKIALTVNSKQIRKAVRQHKLAAFFGVEGGHMIEDNLANLDSFYNRGARYLTLTWNNSTSWATSAMEETRGTFKNPKKGLNDFGVQVVKRMNELGMMVDLSHVGEQTFWDAINLSTKPVIASHSCVYNLCPAFRTLKDDQIRAIGKNGGIIDINFFSGFLDSNYEKRNTAFAAKHKAEKDSLRKINPEPYFTDEYLYEKYPTEVENIRAPLSLVIDHIDYIVKMIGIDHVGLGSDFDGINSGPKELDDVTCYPVITKALAARGYSKKDIRKILGGNFMRVMKANEVGR
jgi:membrane dipeptidase